MTTRLYFDPTVWNIFHSEEGSEIPEGFWQMQAADITKPSCFFDLIDIGLQQQTPYKVAFFFSSFIVALQNTKEMADEAKKELVTRKFQNETLFRKALNTNNELIVDKVINLYKTIIPDQMNEIFKEEFLRQVEFQSNIVHQFAAISSRNLFEWLYKKGTEVFGDDNWFHFMSNQMNLKGKKPDSFDRAIQSALNKFQKENVCHGPFDTFGAS